MIRSQLNSYSGADPIWGFVALIGSERYTGEVAIGIDPRIRLFAADGRVYFAEREGDAPIGTRLVNCGAVSTSQLSNGSVQIGNTSSLARLFQREPSIDRDAVELTIELATESLLESVANKAVGMPEVFPLRHHSSGVHHWLRSAAAAPAAVPTVVEAPVVEEGVAVHAPVVEEVVAVQPPVIEETVAVEAPVEAETVIAESPVVAWTLPTLSALVTPVVAEPVVAEPVVAPMPTLASLTLPTLQKASAPQPEAEAEAAIADAPAVAHTTEGFFAQLPEQVAAVPPNPYEPVAQPAGLPKLASAPISMTDLVAANAIPASPFGEPTHTFAAVDIWEMVDVLTDDGHPEEQELVGSGSSAKRGRSWLRGKKG